MNIGAVILAAGASERMGRCKALLDYGGETALARLARGAREGAQAMEVVVVAAAPHLEDVRKEAGTAGVPVVENRTPQIGRTHSIQLGLRALAPGSSAFIAPVDCPLVEPADFLALRRELEAAMPTRPLAAVPTCNMHHGHPVLLSTDGAAAVLGMHPNDSLREMLRKNGKRVVSVALPDRVLLNVDSPADYAAARKKLGLASGPKAGA